MYAYGNPGRGDDGLGNRLIEELGPWILDKGLAYVELDSNFQLNIEDAEAIRRKDIVVFVDASKAEIEGFRMDPVEPSEGRSEFTMHAASPAYILALCSRLYHRQPETYILQIRGYEWDFREGLSSGAEENLGTALAFLKERLLRKNFGN